MSTFGRDDLRQSMLEGIEYGLSVHEGDVTLKELVIALHCVIGYLMDDGHLNYPQINTEDES